MEGESEQMASALPTESRSAHAEKAAHRRLLREHRQVLELVARGEPAARCLEELCLAIERIDHRVRACVFLADVDRRCFTVVAAPRFPALADAIGKLREGGNRSGTGVQLAVPDKATACADIAGDPLWHETWKSLCLSHSVRAVYSAPVGEKDSPPRGSIVLCFEGPKEPSEWDIALADMAAGVAAIVLARDRSADALAASRQALAAELAAARHLHAVSTQLIQADDIESLYEKILDTAIAIMRSDFASFQMLDSERGELQLLGHRNFDAETALFWRCVRATSATSCGMALRTGRRCVVPDVERCEFMAGSDDLERFRATGILALQTTPLFSRSGALLGMISTHWRQRHAPSESDFRSLDVLARQAADLIERMRSEEALREANRHKDEFLATLAHELRNPIAPLRNALQVLKLKSNRNEHAPESVRMMERQIDYIVRLVDDLLDVSRLTRGLVALHKERVNLTSVLTEAAEAIRPTCESMGHRFTVSIPPEPLWLDGDRTRLAEVLHNLLQNACKFTGRGGCIYLHACREGDEAVVRVKDNGVGLEPEQLPRVFEMFMQVDTSLARSGGGLGIGLTLVRNLVAMHGGTVAAESAGIGRGSEFVVRFPVSAGADSAEVRTAPVAEPADVARRRILVVDDNRDSADSLAQVLQLRGHDVRTAYDGLAAVASAASFEPDLILLDIGLPELDGYEAARRIREQRGGDGLTLVALTGWGQETDRRQSADAGFDHHLVKPIEPAVLDRLLAG